MLPKILAILPNLIVNLLPQSNPIFVNKKLNIENNNPHKTVFSSCIPNPIPTEKLSILTLNANNKA